MAKWILPVILLGLTFVSTSCGSKQSENRFGVEDSAEVQPVDILRLDSLIAAYPSMSTTQKDAFLRDNKEVLNIYGQIIGVADTLSEADITSMVQGEVYKWFAPDVAKDFPTLAPEEKAFATMLASARANGLTLPATRMVSVIWPLRLPIVIADTINTVYFALNHYLGEEHAAYAGYPESQRKHKNRANIPADMAEALLATAYPYQPNNGETNVASRLIYEGALATAKQALVPDAGEAMTLGFTDNELASIKENESFVWRALVKDNRLFSSDAQLMSNLFDNRTNSSVISADAPPQTARYPGWRIVQNYLKKHPDMTLPLLLSPDFYSNATEVIRDAGYAPLNN